MNIVMLPGFQQSRELRELVQSIIIKALTSQHRHLIFSDALHIDQFSYNNRQFRADAPKLVADSVRGGFQVKVQASPQAQPLTNR